MTNKLLLRIDDKVLDLDVEIGQRLTFTGPDGKLHWVLLETGTALTDKNYRNREWLSDAYHTQSLTLQQIGDMCGVSPMTINQWLRKHSIPSRPRGRRTP